MDNTILNEKGSFSTPSAPANRVAQFEDYLYFAALQRLAEETATTTTTKMPTDEAQEKPQGMGNWFTRISHHKGQNVNFDVQTIENPVPPTAEEQERENASRALRLASWSTVFYLITTDILGPFNAPYAIAQVGWVPGIKFHPLLYLIMFLTCMIFKFLPQVFFFTFSVCDFNRDRSLILDEFML